VQILTLGYGTILHAASQAHINKVEAVMWVLQQLAGTAKELPPDDIGCNPLHRAALLHADVTTLATLFQAGFDVNQPSLRYVEELHLREGLVGGHCWHSGTSMLASHEAVLLLTLLTH
jgi:hypothetical protein